LEPEAAAIYCLHLPDDQRKDMNNLGMKGQKFLVADLGGIYNESVFSVQMSWHFQTQLINKYSMVSNLAIFRYI
jgi:hypothetical protein